MISDDGCDFEFFSTEKKNHKNREIFTPASVFGVINSMRGEYECDTRERPKINDLDEL